MMIKLSEWPMIVEQANNGFARLRSSKFARDATRLFVFNLLSRIGSFFGTAYGMRCLGPVNVGISALVQATVQQVSLAFNCGFDIIATRRIAADHQQVTIITPIVVTFRLVLAVIAALVWVIVCHTVVPESNRWVWMMGAPIMIASTGSIAFVFNGLEKLPIQNGIGTGGVLLMAVAYFIFFRPGMFLGADLIVITVIGSATMGVSWAVYRRLVGSWPIGVIVVQQLKSLFRESWRYWVQTGAVFFYMVFQIVLVIKMLGPEAGGIYRSAIGLAGALEMLFNSINVLLLSRLVNWRKTGLEAMLHNQRRLLIIYIVIGLPLAAAFILVMPWVYFHILGTAFMRGVPVCRVLVISSMISFVGQIYSWGVVANKQDTQLMLIMTGGALISVVLNVLFIPLYGIIVPAIVSALVSAFMHFLCYIVLCNDMKKNVLARPN